MKDLTTLTHEEANKLECMLLTLTSDIEKIIDTYDKLAEDSSFSEDTQRVMKSNAEWYRECYLLIYGKEYPNEN